MTPVETIASTIWLQMSDYSQMSHYIIWLQLYRIISEKKKKKKKKKLWMHQKYLNNL